MYQYSFTYKTIYSDLDTQHHVNSNRYFALFESGKYLLLEQLGFSKRYLFENQIALVPYQTKFRFLKQVVDNEWVKVNVNLRAYRNGYLKWTAEIIHQEELCFQIHSVNKFFSDLFLSIVLNGEMFCEFSDLYDLKIIDNKKYGFEYQVRNTDRDYFGCIPENLAWKWFEDTRWNHSGSLGITLNKLAEMDIAFFLARRRIPVFKYFSNFAEIHIECLDRANRWHQAYLCTRNPKSGK